MGAKTPSHLGRLPIIAQPARYAHVLSDDFSEVEERVESLDTVFPIDLIDLSLTYKKGIEDEGFTSLNP